ncbi:type III secretion inner membrane ring lipoprotein SctJ [Pseudomonas plecoglossicida]|nr:type III secretion inner membrane ring lipoprotein SctJ [Pseudomonas plecoglossicida]
MVVVLLLLVGCRVELYQGLSQKEANEMLALLATEGISASKETDKSGKTKVIVDDAKIARAIEVLKREGLPREAYSSLKDVFPKDSLISSPLEERARLNYAKAQELSKTLSEIDGVLTARVHVVLPEEREGLGKKTSPASASVFIKYVAGMQFDAYVPQIKQLLSNSLEGLEYERISVVLIPSANVRQAPAMPALDTFLSIQVAESSRARLMMVFGLLMVLLVLSNLAQLIWWRSR